jgi:hypothetical protein
MHWVESEESVNYGWHWRQYFGFIGDWYTQLGILMGWVGEGLMVRIGSEIEFRVLNWWCFVAVRLVGLSLTLLMFDC